jgi:transcriptional regulator with XRE-family HTH domain
MTASKVGAKRGRGRPRNETGRRTVAELRARGWTLRRIAEQMGVTHQNVAHLLKAGGAVSAERAICCQDCGAVLLAQPHGAAVGVSAWCLDCLGRHPEAPFGERLKAFRLAVGLSQRQLESHTGVDHRTVAGLEAGRVRLTPPLREALVRCFGLALVPGGPS